jgi:hypothetical protein
MGNLGQGKHFLVAISWTLTGYLSKTMLAKAIAKGLYPRFFSFSMTNSLKRPIFLSSL